ncbi:SDR family oxidoreductase [Actinomyces viscosus]|nr:SDR family oxidoreductase [Actinomyces viscosus]
MPLAGRTVLVTGVSRRVGIGHAIACRAADYGASVVAHHYRPHDASQPWGADDVEAVMASIRTHLVGPARLIDIGADLAAPGEPARVVEQAVAGAGHLDALVCNQAMSSPDGPLAETTEAILDAHWAVDARASILLAQAFAGQDGFAAPAPQRAGRRHGAIVFLTSGQGLGPLPGEVAYAAAKAAIAGVTLTIADELIDVGITVNTVNPGPVDTGYVTEADRRATAAMFPQGRWGEPDDAARLITWLLTDEARWITGQVISSEGGFARWRH